MRVTAAGTKSWSFVFRPRGGRQKRFTIGDYPAWSLSQARDKAWALRRRVQDGGDPVAERRAQDRALTVAGLVDRFIELHAKRKLRSWKDYQALLKRDVVRQLGDRRADDVTPRKVRQLLEEIAGRAPVVANRVWTSLSSVYNWGVSEDLVTRNPVAGLKRRTLEVAKERFLSDAEIRAFWVASESIAPAYRDIFRLILLTGQRPGECAGMAAEEVDLDKGLWLIPAGRVKNKRNQAVPLVGEALAIVAARAAHVPTGPLIPTPRGKTPTVQDVAKAFERLRATKIFATPATAHDLRRTAATLLGRLEIDRITIGYVLNHSSTTRATVTGSTYDKHDYMPQRRRALEVLDNEIRRIVSGTAAPENVLPMRRER